MKTIWYLHIHFVCAKLFALLAKLLTFLSYFRGLNNLYYKTESEFFRIYLDNNLLPTRIAGGFMFRHIQAQQTKVHNEMKEPLN